MTAPAPKPTEWRIQQTTVMQRSDKQVLAQLRKAEKEINSTLFNIARRKGIGAQARQTQLLLAKREIQREMSTLFVRLGDVISARRLEAAARVLDVNKALDTFKLLGAGLPDGAEVAAAIADAELDAARSGLDRMIRRVQGSSYKPLSERVYVSSTGLNGPISTLVNSSLAAGLSAREFAKAAKDFINPNTPGGVQYAAMRLSRTEINNAAHAVAVDAVQDKPWVTGMKWHLSGSHPRADICDKLAHGGPNGDGVYPKTEVPAKPHPQCFCYPTPETPDDDEFLDNLVAGHYNEYLDKYRNIEPGQVIRSDRPGISTVGAKRAVSPAPRKVPAQTTVKPSVNVPATPPRAATAAPKKVLTPEQQLIQNMIRAGQQDAEMVRLLKFLEPDEAKARALIQGVRDVTDLDEWVGSIADSVKGVVREQAQAAVDASRNLIGGKINRLKRVEMHDPRLSTPEVNKAIQSAYACCQGGQVTLARDLAQRIASLERCQRAGWFSPTATSVNQLARTTAHEIGHAFTVGYLDAQTTEAFFRAIADHLGIARPAVMSSFSDAVGFTKWMRKPGVRERMEREFGKYACEKPQELFAEIWAPFTMDPNPTSAIKFAGNLMLKIIKEGKL